MSPEAGIPKDTPSDTRNRALEKFVKTTDPLANRKAFLKMLTSDERHLYERFIKQLVEETGDALTSAEYEQLAVIRFWLDRYDAWATGKKPDEITSSVAEVARRYRGMLIEALERERDRATKKSDRFDQVKRFALELEKDGELILIQGKREKIVDVDAKEVKDADRGEAQEGA